MNGILNVLKPPGMTSHDVVAFLRKVLHTKKIGHGGTLDPDAAGVLPVFVGSATRLLEFSANEHKSYIVEITMGRQTDTGDDSGRVIKSMPVPEISSERLEQLLCKFIGKQLQLPPMYSAVKINGQKLYKLARRGIDVDRSPREIEIYKLELLLQKEKKLIIAVECSKGTYVRVLAEDIAHALETCGTVTFLLRTRVGNYKIDDAHTLQEITAQPEAYIQSPLTAVSKLPRLNLLPQQAMRITEGVRTTVSATSDGRYVLIGPGGEFLGLGICSESMIQPEKIFQHYILQEE
ncbi:MAG: tRNA pseudouridine(55) synthase TruB [Phascolarctobacterium sp.]|nr:tRNA pseudouridine(55) synthase TruB [Phascolarctobacterium sp.]